MMTTQSLGDGGMKDVSRFMGPAAVDANLRQVIVTCWYMMPENKRTIDAVETEIRRLVDRAFRDMREDGKAFGVS